MALLTNEQFAADFAELQGDYQAGTITEAAYAAAYGALLNDWMVMVSNGALTKKVQEFLEEQRLVLNQIALSNIKGKVEGVGDLPADAANGDAYVVEDDGHVYLRLAGDWEDIGQFNGQSAYQVWLLLPGNAGKTQTEFFEFLAAESLAVIEPLVAQVDVDATAVETARAQVVLLHAAVQGWHADVEGWKDAVELARADVAAKHGAIVTMHGEVDADATAVETARAQVVGLASTVETQHGEVDTARDQVVAIRDALAVTGRFWRFDPGTADADPGAGNLRFNAADPAAAGWVYFDQLNGAGVDQGTSYLDQLDDRGTNGGRGWLTLTGVQSGAQFTANVINTVVAGVGYRKVQVTSAAVAGAFIAGEDVAVDFSTTGLSGTTGVSAGPIMGFSNSTVDANPGAGIFRLNAATMAAATFVYVNAVANGGIDLSAYWAMLDDIANAATRGVLYIQQIGNQSKAAEYHVKSVTAASGYFKIEVVAISAGAGTFDNGAFSSFIFAPAGADGAGTGDFTGPAGGVASDQLVAFASGTGKAGKGAVGVTAPAAGRLQLEAASPAIILKESDQTLPAGLHRIIAESGGVQVQRNTAVAGDFSTNNIVIDIAFDGRVGLSNILSITSGTPEFRFGESDLTDPTGRFRFQVNGGTFRMQRATAANWASAATFLNCGNDGSVNIYGAGAGISLNNNTTLLSGATLTLAQDGTNALHAVTLQQMQNAMAGQKPKGSVRAASTGNVVLSGLQTIDTIALAADNLVLLKDQTAPAENGIWVVKAGAWVRAAVMDAWSEVPGAQVVVEQGSVGQADSGWLCTADQGGTLGTTAITWVKWFGTGLYQTASANLSAIAGLSALSANVLSFLGAADYTAMRALLSINVAAAADVWAGTDDAKFLTSKALTDAHAASALVDGATVNWDWATQSFNATLAMAGNRVVAKPTNMKAWRSFILKIVPTGGSFSPSFATGWNFLSSGPPAWNTTAGKANYLFGFYDPTLDQAVVTGFAKEA